MISRLLDRRKIFLPFVFCAAVGGAWYFLLVPLSGYKGLILLFGLSIFTLALFGLSRKILSGGQYDVFFLSFWMLTFYESFTHLFVSVSLACVLCALGLFPIEKDQPTVKTRLYYSGFFIGLAGIFFPPSLLYFVWVVLALLFNGERDLKNRLICIMGLVTPFWLCLSGYYLLDDVSDMAVVDYYYSFLNFSLLPLDVHFYFFCAVCVFCLVGVVNTLAFSKKQNAVFKRLLRRYLLTVFPGGVILLLYSRDTGQYAFLMAPLCLILSDFLLRVKSRRLKEIVLWTFVLIGVFSLGLRLC